MFDPGLQARFFRGVNTPANLQTNYPAASWPGRFAQVGSSAPYSIYWSDGVNWVDVSSSNLATTAQGEKADSALQPAGTISTPSSLSTLSSTGSNLLKVASLSQVKSDLSIVAADVVGTSEISRSVIKSLQVSDVLGQLGIGLGAPTYTFIPLGVFATIGDLQTQYPASSYNGFYALVGSTNPWTSYKSDGVNWISVATSSTLSLNIPFTVPTTMQTNGGFIAITGCAGGGGGGGGNATTGGGGGGGGNAAYRHYVWVPAGHSTIYLTVGLGGAGGVGTSSGGGGSGVSGTITAVSLSTYNSIFLLRLLSGQQGVGGSSTDAITGGAGGAGGGGWWTGGSAGTNATNGGAGNPALVASGSEVSSVSRLYNSAGGGGGAGSTATSAGVGGRGVGGVASAGSGAGAGGGGATAPYGSDNNTPVMNNLGTPGHGGAGGASPTAGTNCTCFGGGGGGGGKTQSGGGGGNGFLIIEVFS